MKFILAFGNPFVPGDTLALDIADHFQRAPLEGVEFIKCLAPDEIFQYIDRDFFILDVAKGPKELTLIDDPGLLEANPLVSLHDFDLGFFLRLAKEMGQLDRVRIICLPMDMDLKTGIEEVRSFLKM